jgi:septum formation protein
LLTRAGIEYSLVESEFDEASLRGRISDPREYVCANAIQKGRWVVDKPAFRKTVQGPTVVISADTIVVLGRSILEKPKDAEEAVIMLQSLSHKTHTVLSSLCFHLLLSKEGSYHCLEETFATEVSFRHLPDAEIRDYVRGGEPMDKAGAYAMQGRGASFVTSLAGSPTNVIGLPLAETIEWLERAPQIFQSMQKI